MRRKYSISFFVAITICLVVLFFAYRMSYQGAKEQAKQEAPKQNEKISVPTEGDATKADIYYLKDVKEFVVVYLSDKQTVFEYTNIRMDDLPENVANEIRNWKSMEDLERLYGFLENYSS